MLFRKLRFCNFMSYGNYWTEIDFSKVGLRLIIGNNKDEGGSNGAGKTTILEVLCWILFGKTIRDIPIDKIINYTTNCNTIGELEFASEGNEYKITRYRNHVTMGNKLEVVRNGEDITKSSIKLTEEYLFSEALPLDWHSFTNSIVFSAENMVNFIGLEARDKRSMLEKMLKLELFSSYQGASKTLAKQYDNKILDTQFLLDQKNTILVTDQKQLEIYNKKFEEFEVNRKKIMEDCDRIVKECSEMAVEEAIRVFEEIKQMQHTIEANNQQVQTLMLEQAKIDYRASMYARQQKEGEKNKLLQKINKIKALGNVCPTCEGEIREEHKIKAAEELQAEIIELDKEIAIHRMAESSLRVESARFDEQINKLRQDIRNLSSRISAITPDLELEELMNIKAKIEQQQSISERTGQEKNPYSEVINAAHNKIATLMGEITNHIEQIKQAKESKSYFDFWHKAFGHDGLKVYVLENVIPVLNSRVNYYLSILFSGNDWKVTFDKHLNENISRNGVMGLNYNMNSQGERRRIDLALSFAIFDVLRMQYGTVSNVLFFDEVFDTGLDGVGTQKVYEVLRNSKMPTIFVISHKETLVDNFDNVLEVTCEKGLSRVTQK